MSFQKNAGAVRLFGQAMRFAAWLQSLPARLTPPPIRLLQTGSAFWQSRTLYVAARLDIATVLGDEELDAPTIAARIQADPDAIRRLLRLLAATGIFEETRSASFRNNKTSSFLRRDNPGNVRALVLMHNSPAMSRPWFEQLERGVREGIAPFRLTHGQDLFSYLDRDAQADALFSAAMDDVEKLDGSSFATDFDWSRFQRVIDVGGSRGTKALAILKHHPRLTAWVIDRPQTIAEARRYWATHAAEGLERLQFEAGDILERVPPARDDQDIYLLSAVLHGFDDASCTLILRAIAVGIHDTGARVAVLELVMPEVRADLARASFDMQMFMGTPGRERTLTEWKALFSRCALELEEVVGLRSFGSILVLRTDRSRTRT